jgi:hypothetical protein
VPAIGVRLMWTSNTDMKIDTRVSGASPRSPTSSRGTGTFWIIVTRPSAGAMISPSPVGVVRTGSRKKVSTQTTTASSGQNSTLVSTVPSNVMPRAMAAYLCPSG